MKTIWLVTIEDQANFQKVEFREAFARKDEAEDFAEAFKKRLVNRDAHHGLGDTFSVTVESFEVWGL